jgi:hypothetical protein
VIRSACCGDGQCFVGTQNGIVSIDAQGTVRHLNRTMEFPAADTKRLAHHEGKLFAFLEGGYLVAVDVPAGRFEVIASSQRRERLSPFDDGEKFRIDALLVDAERDRLLLLVHQKDNRPEDFLRGAFPKDNQNGLWEYDLKGQQFRRRLPLYSDRVNLASAVEPGRWLLSHQAKDTVVDFDLKTDRAEVLLGLAIPGPDFNRLQRVRQQPPYPFYRYAWRHEGHLWALDSRALVRVSLKDGRAETVAGFASGETPYSAYHHRELHRIGPGRLLLQNGAGVWILEMPQLTEGER